VGNRDGKKSEHYLFIKKATYIKPTVNTQKAKTLFTLYRVRQ